MIYKPIFIYTKVHSSSAEIHFYLSKVHYIDAELYFHLYKSTFQQCRNPLSFIKSTLHIHRIIFPSIQKYVPTVQKSTFIYQKYLSEFPNRN